MQCEGVKLHILIIYIMSPLGEKIVKAEVNTSKDELVDRLKNKFAELIILIEELRDEGCSPEKHRLISMAKTEIETGWRHSVKANFTKW